MSVLPKFLYLFQSFPMFITKCFISNLNSQISTFIWNKKQTRIGKKVLQLPCAMGGMSLPNFMYYYWAANIKTVLYWMRRDNVNPSWMALEGASIELTSPAYFLCSKLPFKQRHSIQLKSGTRFKSYWVVTCCTSDKKVICLFHQ